MGLLADYFSSSYDAYIAYFGRRSERDYVYVLVNNDLSTQEILKQNPAGTKEIGLTFLRSKKYHGINTSVTLEVEFSKDDYAGGTFLFNAFDNKGIRADVDCFIYRKNPATDDFDILYEGKVDFTEKSYSHRPNDRSIKATLHEQGFQNSFLSRDTLELDITKTKAIDGSTVTAISRNLITYKAVDIYLLCEAYNGQITQFIGFPSTGNNTAYYTGGSESINLTSGRANFETPTSGRIYENSSGESKDVRFNAEFGYFIQTDVPVGGSMTTYIRYYVYNSVGTPIDSNTITTFTNAGEGIKTETGTDTFDSGYISVPDGGYCAYFVYTTYTGTSAASVDFTQVGDRNYILYEKSPSIGDSNIYSYRAPEVMRMLMRLCTGNDNSFNYIPASISCYRDYIISGYLLREFPNKGIVLSFEQVFNTCSRIDPKCLIYDADNGYFQLNEIDEAYQDIQVLSLGKVRNLEISPDGYINDIQGGCDSDGKYEQDQGINEFNVRHNFATSFEIDGKLDLRTPLSLDTMGIELTRRENYALTGLTDTRFDKFNFYVRTSSNETEQNALFPSGFAGIEQYYNTRYNARENIIRNGPILAGMFYKDTGESIKFTSNAKDININYVDTSTGTLSLQDDITQAELGTPLFYPEKIRFETDLTHEQLSTFRANPHGYITIEDDEGTEYNLYVDVFETKDDKFTVNIEGKLANIGR